MMHRVWCSIDDVPYSFQGHLSNFNVTRDKGSSILTQIGRFRAVTPVWIHWWLWNDAHSLKQQRSDAFFQCRPSNFNVTRDQNKQFDPNWAFPDCNFNLNSPMDFKWWTKLDVVQKRCPIVFRGHPSNFKVTRAENWFESNLSKITRPIAAIKSPLFVFFLILRPKLSRTWQYYSLFVRI